MTFPATIRAARLAAGLTQAELAAQLGSFQQVVARWEGGLARPQNLQPLADALGLDAEQLAASAAEPMERRVRRRNKTCRECEHEPECKRRVRLGLWVLCETPDADDLKFAEARGLA